MENEQPIKQSQAELLEELKNAAASSEETEFIDNERLPETPAETPSTEDNPNNLNPGISNNEISGEQQKPTAGDIITGRQLIHGVDFLLSSLFSMGASAITKRNVSPDYFRMDAQEKKINGDALTECLKTINVNFNNPWVALAVVMGGTYVGKIAQVANDISLEKIDKKEDKLSKKGAGRGRPKGSTNKAKTDTENNETK